MRQIGLGFVIFLGLSACSNPGDFESDQGLLREFKYLGCKGEWEDETDAPEVLREQKGAVTTYLVRHNDGCGYDRGMAPQATLSGEALKLDYRLEASGEGDRAACICEYRARFGIATPATPISSVVINGKDARVSAGEAFR